MSIQSLFHSMDSIGFLVQFRSSALVYPIVMTIHLACIAVFGGLILMTDMRLLGVALRSYSVSEVVAGFRPWKRLGGVIMLSAGLLLGSSQADKYYPNPFFWTKLFLLLGVGIHALVFRPLVYNRTEEIDKAGEIPATAKWAAGLSLLLWLGILSMGRLIGYWEPPR